MGREKRTRTRGWKGELGPDCEAELCNKVRLSSAEQQDKGDFQTRKVSIPGAQFPYL